MAHHDDLIASDILGYLQAQENKSFLRFITCGSVDDGKSTLIGRLLYDSKLIYEDQLASIEKDSKKSGTQGEKIDLALLVDGLAAEREQGITIDVAYRFFSTDKRKFIVADTPGHEQYTRNMATGASTADVAILLIDARYGVQVQTRRHAYIASLLGIKHIVCAVNKMDLNGFSQSVFSGIEEDFRSFSKDLGFKGVTFIPMSALDGDNVTIKSSRADWYRGPALLEYLETVDVEAAAEDSPFRLPVQWVNRPDLDFRGFSGTVASGKVSVGDEIIVVPSGKRSAVKSIVTHSDDLPFAVEDQAITLTLADEIDISRGDVICAADHPADQSDQFQAHVLWMSEKELLPGRQYLLKTNNKTVPASVTNLKYKVDVNDFSEEAGKTLGLNEVGVCTLSLDAPIAFDPYRDNRHTGSFILIDRLSNATVGVGMLDFSLRRAKNVVWQDLQVGKPERAAQKNQKPAVLWFTGLSGSGKSTIANLVEKMLFDLGRHTYTLDGDNVRHGLNKDLGFTDADRVENIRRISEMSKLMVDAGLVTLVSFISPFRAERQIARGMLEDDEFIEIYVNTPLEVVEKRDVKGLYAKARAGLIKNFTGIDSEYQAPQNPEIQINTVDQGAEEAAAIIVEYLRENGYLDRPDVPDLAMGWTSSESEGSDMTHYHVFNGDADGLCAMVQLYRAAPNPNAVIVTGRKRDIKLLERVDAKAGDHVTVLDVSMHSNKTALVGLLDAGAQVFYADHHNAGDIPGHKNLTAHIDTSPEICTAAIVDDVLGGAYRAWAVCAAFGDNFPRLAQRMGEGHNLPLERLQHLGILINYNGYGADLSDLFFDPAKLYKVMREFDTPMAFLAEKPDVFKTLDDGYRSDMQSAKAANVIDETDVGIVLELADCAASRRVSGVYANELAQDSPARAHAMLTRTMGGYVVSVRAPLSKRQGADTLCLQFETGGGRSAAAGINLLPERDLTKFITAFRAAF